MALDSTVKKNRPFLLVKGERGFSHETLEDRQTKNAVYLGFPIKGERFHLYERKIISPANKLVRLEVVEEESWANIYNIGEPNQGKNHRVDYDLRHDSIYFDLRNILERIREFEKKILHNSSETVHDYVARYLWRFAREFLENPKSTGQTGRIKRDVQKTFPESRVKSREDFYDGMFLLIPSTFYEDGALFIGDINHNEGDYGGHICDGFKPKRGKIKPRCESSLVRMVLEGDRVNMNNCLRNWRDSSGNVECYAGVRYNLNQDVIYSGKKDILSVIKWLGTKKSKVHIKDYALRYVEDFARNFIRDFS